ncbi:threonine-phosphate decarboxylase [Herbidospora galbida]|uniref:Aminotransferase n=1 Tax=Herbidospora galbida TaxID=2575442 RepID=A0A4U3MGB4_9ACTN|nr:Rv2231c family pyridoxal phosphate-dependent protein CobC [Herbidospora galbida]TKK87354.1 threonine-phosphate decarboxylase [Herbidospora galbida]
MPVDLRHHGDSEIGPGLVDLAVNVRQGMPPTWLRELLATSLSDISAYPNADRATRIVAGHHGRDPEEVLLTVGAAEAFTLLARVLATPGRAWSEPAGYEPGGSGSALAAPSPAGLPVSRPVVVHPQFTEPEAALRAVGFVPDRVLLPDPFVLDASLVPDDADLVMIGNPTNPTSVLHPAATIASLAREGRYLVVDEAFADCVPGEPESLASVRLPGLVVIRSLTKTWGLAGLRIGYVIGPPELVAAMREAQPLWAVSTPALAAAEACVSPRAQAEAFRWAGEMADRRRVLVDGLTALGAYVVPEAQGSFVCVRLPHALQLRTLLRERGFAVRRADTFPGLGPEWLRVAVRDDETTAAFLAALKEARDDLPA